MPDIARLGGSSGALKAACVLLAAGAGTRLRPLTEVVPKIAVPLLDVPLGAYGLRTLTSGPGRGGRLIMNVSHLGAEAVEALGPLFPGLEILDEGRAPYGTGGTLRALRDRLTERFAVVNGDLVTDLEIADLAATHIERGAPATVAVRPSAAAADFQGAGGRLTRFIDRRAEPGAPGFTYIGAAVLEREVVDLVPEAVAGLTEVILAPLAEKGNLAYHLHEGYSCDVGTPERYLGASLDLLAGRVTGPGAPGRVIEVPGGTAYLGSGANARPGSLGPGAVVLAGAEVEGTVRTSIVWPAERVPAGTEVRDAIWFRGAPIPV